MPTPRFVPVAEHSVLVQFSDGFDDDSHQAVLALDRALASTTIEGIVEVVPALVNLLVRFDPLLTDHVAIEAEVKGVLSDDRMERPPTRHHEVPVCYDPSVAPDLAGVAEACDLSPDEVIAAHCSATYRVLMYGFAPGYAYLDGLPPRLRLPRKPVPVRGVPAGSILIAGPQCLVTTLDMPTGWWIIGQSPTRVLSPEAEHPFLFDLGDEIRFSEITLADLRS